MEGSDDYFDDDDYFHREALSAYETKLSQLGEVKSIADSIKICQQHVTSRFKDVVCLMRMFGSSVAGHISMTQSPASPQDMCADEEQRQQQQWQQQQEQQQQQPAAEGQRQEAVDRWGLRCLIHSHLASVCTEEP